MHHDVSGAEKPAQPRNAASQASFFVSSSWYLFFWVSCGVVQLTRMPAVLHSAAEHRSARTTLVVHRPDCSGCCSSVAQRGLLWRSGEQIYVHKVQRFRCSSFLHPGMQSSKRTCSRGGVCDHRFVKRFYCCAAFPPRFQWSRLRQIGLHWPLLLSNWIGCDRAGNKIEKNILRSRKVGKRLESKRPAVLLFKHDRVKFMERACYSGTYAMLQPCATVLSKNFIVCF